MDSTRTVYYYFVNPDLRPPCVPTREKTYMDSTKQYTILTQQLSRLTTSDLYGQYTAVYYPVTFTDDI